MMNSNQVATSRAKFLKRTLRRVRMMMKMRINLNC